MEEYKSEEWRLAVEVDDGIKLSWPRVAFSARVLAAAQKNLIDSRADSEQISALFCGRFII